VKNYQRLGVLSIVLSLFLTKVYTQEIPRGFVLPVEVTQGFRSVPGMNNQFYIAALRIQPMHAVLDNNVRIGLTASLDYSNPTVDLLAGPRLSYRIMNNMTLLGSIFNLQICGESLWGTREHKLWGLGGVLEGGPVIITIRGNHEYEFKEFWFEASVGLNIDTFFKKKDEDPLHN
jgi:hypothetical protein